MIMEKKITVAGFGGQGVMVIGQMLGYASCKAGRNALFLPKYGPEQRGERRTVRSPFPTARSVLPCLGMWIPSSP